MLLSRPIRIGLISGVDCNTIKEGIHVVHMIQSFISTFGVASFLPYSGIFDGISITVTVVLFCSTQTTKLSAVYSKLDELGATVHIARCKNTCNLFREVVKAVTMDINMTTTADVFLIVSPYVLFFRTPFRTLNFSNIPFISSSSKCGDDLVITNTLGSNDLLRNRVFWPISTHDAVSDDCIFSENIDENEAHGTVSFRAIQDDYVVSMVGGDPCTIQFDVNIIPAASIRVAHGTDRLYCERLVDFVYLQLLLDSTGLVLSKAQNSVSGYAQQPLSKFSKDTVNTGSFYIHSLAPFFADPVPISRGGFNDDFIVDADRLTMLYSERKSLLTNDGAGALVSETFHMYDTKMHSLFQHMLRRFQISPFRNQNPDKAKFYLIPYDISQDTPYGDEFRHYPGCPLAPAVISHVSNTSAWKKYGGHDHIIIMSSIPSNIITHSRCSSFLLQFCRLCVKIVVEDVYSRCPFQGIRSSLSLTWLQVPYPSTYHFPRTFHPEWITEERMRRNHAITFIGSSWANSVVSYRPLLESACMSLHNDSNCRWISTTHMKFTSNLTNIYRDSVFCLMPGGPTKSRKAIVDALLSGCVPVVFDTCTLHYLWPLHIDSNKALQISIHFPAEKLQRNSDALSHVLTLFAWLLAIRDSDEIRLKRKAIRELAQNLQYSIWSPDESNNTSPYADAFDVTFTNLLRRFADRNHPPSEQPEPLRTIIERDDTDLLIAVIIGLTTCFLQIYCHCMFCFAHRLF